MRRLSEDRGAILRMAGNIAGGLISQGIESDEVAPIAVTSAIRIVRDLDARIAEEAPPTRPPRTGYVDNAGTYHPSPDSADYPGHATACAACTREAKANAKH